MKKHLSLNIPSSCSEKWDSFTQTSTGRHCGTCNTVVIDFTRMSDDQILDFFSNQTDRTCGRFRPDQLKSYVLKAPVTINPGFSLLKAGLLSLLFVLISKPGTAHTRAEKVKSELVRYTDHQAEEITVSSEYIVRGIVKSEEDDSPLPGVNVYLKGSTTGTTTDAEGRFEFPVKLKEGDVLVFSFIGSVTQEYKVQRDSADVIDIHMGLYWDIMGAVAVDGPYTQHQSGFKVWWQKVKGLF